MRATPPAGVVRSAPVRGGTSPSACHRGRPQALGDGMARASSPSHPPPNCCAAAMPSDRRPGRYRSTTVDNRPGPAHGKAEGPHPLVRTLSGLRARRVM